MRHATIADYVIFQGGVPHIFEVDGIWHIVHQYREDSPIVRTRNNPYKGEPVALHYSGSDDVVIFESSKLWAFEGAPCERQSLMNGGSGYQRANKNGQT